MCTKNSFRFCLKFYFCGVVLSNCTFNCYDICYSCFKNFPYFSFLMIDSLFKDKLSSFWARKIISWEKITDLAGELTILLCFFFLQVGVLYDSSTYSTESWPRGIHLCSNSETIEHQHMSLASLRKSRTFF